MSTLTDDDLTRLLDTAAECVAVPADGPDGVIAAVGETALVVPLRRRRSVRVLAIAAAVTGALVVGGSVLDGYGAEPAPVEVAAASTASTEEQAAADTPGSGGGGAAADTAPAATLDTGQALDDLAAPDTTRRNQAKAAQPGVQAPAPSEGRVVKTGQVALLVEDGQVSATLTDVQEAASDSGGLVFGSTTQESGPTPSGTVTVRVPVARFEELLLQVRGLGSEVRSASTSAKEVTAQFSDLETQIRTLTASRERFLAILEGASDIGSVLAVQQRVDDVTTRIDRLTGQLKVLADQSDLSTLAVTVTERDDPAVQEEEPDTGLSKAFRDGVDGFTSGVEALVRRSGRALLALICLAGLAVAVRLGWRVGRRRLV